MSLPTHDCPECEGEAYYVCECHGDPGCYRCFDGEVPCQFCAGQGLAVAPAECPQCNLHHGGDLHPDLEVVSALCPACEHEKSEGAPTAGVSRVPGPPLVHSAPTAFGGSSGARPHKAQGVPGPQRAEDGGQGGVCSGPRNKPPEAYPAAAGQSCESWGPAAANLLDDERRDSVARRWEADAKPCPRCGYPVLYRHELGRRVALNRSATKHACPERRTA